MRVYAAERINTAAEISMDYKLKSGLYSDNQKTFCDERIPEELRTAGIQKTINYFVQRRDPSSLKRLATDSKLPFVMRKKAIEEAMKLG